MFPGPSNGVQIIQLDQTSKAFENVDQVVIDRNSDWNGNEIDGS